MQLLLKENKTLIITKIVVSQATERHALITMLGKINFFRKIFQEYPQSVIKFGHRIGPDITSADNTGRQV